MWETAAINLYLAETYKNSLYPSTPQSRGRMLQWAFFATTEVEPALITLFRNRIFFRPSSGTKHWPFKQNKPYAQSWRSLRINSSRPSFSAVNVEHGRLYGRVRAVCNHPLKAGPHVLPKTRCLARCSLNRPAARWPANYENRPKRIARRQHDHDGPRFYRPIRPLVRAEEVVPNPRPFSGPCERSGPAPAELTPVPQPMRGSSTRAIPNRATSASAPPWIDTRPPLVLRAGELPHNPPSITSSARAGSWERRRERCGGTCN